MANVWHLIVTAVAASLVSFPAAAQQAVPVPAAAQSAPAAILTNVQGTVLVDAGAGFVPVSTEVGLKLGDRVMVTDEGGAILNYAEDCSLPLESPSMTTVVDAACTTATQGNQNGRGNVVLFAFLGSLIPTFLAIGSEVFDHDDEGAPASP